ncbi:MAG: PRC-barrel domain-containing protein, partial [Gammaproteobacteria bacterium]|jgi:sporulation protein YlmC with PRC-barrel domain
MSKQSQSQLDLSQSYQSDNIIGMEVKNNDGQNIGKISQIIFDNNGQATYVVLSTGGILGMATKDYVVPWDLVNLKHGQKYARINVQKDEISTEFSAFEVEQQPSKTEKPSEEESD